MKKTLVALAVLAASGASFAQITMTGEATWGYRATSTAGSDASGFGVDTSELYFDAVEDIGGGNSVKAHMGIGGLDRGGYGTGGATTGQDFFITVGGASMGTVKFATTKGADYLSGGSSGSVASWNVGMDGRVFSARATSDNITYALPVGPVTMVVGHRETSNMLGEGSGSTGGVGQRKNWITAKGTMGALAFDANYAVYDSKGDVAATNVDDTSIYGSVSYDFGVAKVGFGLESRKKTKGSVNDTYVAAKSPFGSLDLSVEYGSRTYSSEFTNTPNKSGYSVAAVYHLSKRTSLIARTGSFDVGQSSRDTQTDFYIDHTF